MLWNLEPSLACGKLPVSGLALGNYTLHCYYETSYCVWVDH